MAGSGGRRIGGAGGGSSKGKGGGAAGTLVLAGVVALTAVNAGGAGGLGGAGGGGGAGGQSVSVRKAEGQKAAKRGDAEGAWQKFGMRGLRQTARQRAECVVSSFGRVQEYFRVNRCASMDRMLFAVGDGAGNSAVISVVWVGFASRGDAVGFKGLIDEHGSGDVRPLGGAALELADVAFTGRNYGSDRDGSTITIAEAESVSGVVGAEVLDALAEVAARLPRS
ncbi:hypothetical protein FHS29_000141 [Saccharothrix tamanrassetensis]|uniref:Uncharacterized protein n=1 Tax=Saccharothrix tamanrassetensis TaxID=1051531 RepID=A0A841C8X3_9PSEU|nr:hypothetical protein [Saccharothrix tamanrassetensis]